MRLQTVEGVDLDDRRHCPLRRERQEDDAPPIPRLEELGVCLVSSWPCYSGMPICRDGVIMLQGGRT